MMALLMTILGTALLCQLLNLLKENQNPLQPDCLRAVAHRGSRLAYRSRLANPALYRPTHPIYSYLGSCCKGFR